MPRFVVLLHEVPPGYPRGAHYDLMLEHSGALWTWACDRLPAIGQSIPAQRLADHRMEYLDYEGPVSGDRGHVTQVDSGDYELVASQPALLQVRLAGEKLRGVLTLTPDSNDSGRCLLSLVTE
jgi:hypothetical protein